MSAIKFSCPGCDQHIECDVGYAGRQINCPSCQTAMVVPGAVQSMAPPPAPPGPACPGCGVPLGAGTVICTSCGMNLRTGQRIQPQFSTSASLPKPPSKIGGGNAILIGILVVLGGLYGFGWMNEPAALGYVVVQAIFSLVVGIMVLVSAFKDSVGQGFMTMCIPCYALYFVYGRCESALVKGLFSVSILAQLASLAPPFKAVLEH